MFALFSVDEKGEGGRETKTNLSRQRTTNCLIRAVKTEAN